MFKLNKKKNELRTFPTIMGNYEPTNIVRLQAELCL